MLLNILLMITAAHSTDPVSSEILGTAYIDDVFMIKMLSAEDATTAA